MNCPEVQSLLQAYSDGELDLVRSLAIEEHLTGCSECAEQLQNLKSLRSALSSTELYYRAPTALRERLQLATAPDAKPVPAAMPTTFESPTSRNRLSNFRYASAATILLMLGAAIGFLASRSGASADSQLADAVVASHVRSLQAEHLMDVASSDRHTVKPWFLGKIDFSPPVPDLAEQGFPLIGGRLDYLADRPVAALVYHHDKHTINLFIWPADRDEETSLRSLAQHGFHIRHWQHAGMTYWAISDLNEAEIDQFVKQFRESSGT